MKADWQQAGIVKLVDKDGTLFATQVFGTPTSSQMAFSDHLRNF